MIRHYTTGLLLAHFHIRISRLMCHWHVDPWSTWVWGNVCSVLNPEMIIYGVENKPARNFSFVYWPNEIYPNNSCFIDNDFNNIYTPCMEYISKWSYYIPSTNFLQKHTCLIFMHGRKSYARTTEHVSLMRICMYCANLYFVVSPCTASCTHVRRHIYMLVLMGHRHRVHTCFNFALELRRSTSFRKPTAKQIIYIICHYRYSAYIWCWPVKDNHRC